MFFKKTVQTCTFKVFIPRWYNIPEIAWSVIVSLIAGFCLQWSYPVNQVIWVVKLNTPFSKFYGCHHELFDFNGIWLRICPNCDIHYPVSFLRLWHHWMDVPWMRLVTEFVLTCLSKNWWSRICLPFVNLLCYTCSKRAGCRF